MLWPVVALKKTQNGLLDDLRHMIDMTKQTIASTVNTRLTLLYWHVGNRIRKEILQDERAEYGRSIVVSLARQLVLEYGNGFNDKNLHRMIQFAEVFPDEQIVVSLTRQLSWTHFVTLIPLKEPLKREFYAELCRIERMGLILCAGKKGERIELLELDRSGIHVAEYLTVLPPKKILQEKLHKAIVHARKRLEQQPEGSNEKKRRTSRSKSTTERPKKAKLKKLKRSPE